jgi:hypothetical protein
VVAAAPAAAAAAAAEHATAGSAEADVAAAATAAGDVDGVPVPPAQVQAIVDKLVAFVQKNGIQFEVRGGLWQGSSSWACHAVAAASR